MQGRNMNYIRQKDTKLLIFTQTLNWVLLLKQQQKTDLNNKEIACKEFSKVQQTFYKNCDKCMKSL